MIGNGVHISTNGQDWTRHTELPGGNGIAFGAGRFVAATGTGHILTSMDAETWTPAPQLTENLLHSVAYGKDRFVIGGWGPLLVSQDGSNFTRTFHSPRAMRAIAHGNGTIVIAAAIGEGDNDPRYWTNQPALFISSDTGASWRFRHAPWGWDESARSVKHLNGSFIAVGEAGMIALSGDAQEWAITRLQSDRWQAVAFGAGKYCVGGGFGTNPPVAVSTNGTNWLLARTGLPDAINDMAYGAGRFVAVGGGSLVRTPFAASSTNGLDWEIGVQGLTNQLLNVAFGAGRFVAVGRNGLVLTSLDGVSWQQQPAFTTNHLNAVDFAAGVFMATGSGKFLWSSSDGGNWTSHEVGFEQSYSDIGFADGQFFLTGAEHWLVRSAPVLPRLEITTQRPVPVLKLHPLPEIEMEIQTSSDLLNWVPLNTSRQTEPDGSVTVELPGNLQRHFVPRSLEIPIP